MGMQAKLFICDGDYTYRIVRKMYTNTSYEDCAAFDVIVEGVF